MFEMLLGVLDAHSEMVTALPYSGLYLCPKALLGGQRNNDYTGSEPQTEAYSFVQEGKRGCRMKGR